MTPEYQEIGGVEQLATMTSWSDGHQRRVVEHATQKIVSDHGGEEEGAAPLQRSKTGSCIPEWRRCSDSDNTPFPRTTTASRRCRNGNFRVVVSTFVALVVSLVLLVPLVMVPVSAQDLLPVNGSFLNDNVEEDTDGDTGPTPSPPPTDFPVPVPVEEEEEGGDVEGDGEAAADSGNNPFSLSNAVDDDGGDDDGTTSTTTTETPPTEPTSTAATLTTTTTSTSTTLAMRDQVVLDLATPEDGTSSNILGPVDTNGVDGEGDGNNSQSQTLPPFEETPAETNSPTPRPTESPTSQPTATPPTTTVTVSNLRTTLSVVPMNALSTSRKVQIFEDVTSQHVYEYWMDGPNNVKVTTHVKEQLFRPSRRRRRNLRGGDGQSRRIREGDSSSSHQAKLTSPRELQSSSSTAMGELEITYSQILSYTSDLPSDLSAKDLAVQPFDTLAKRQSYANALQSVNPDTYGNLNSVSLVRQIVDGGDDGTKNPVGPAEETTKPWYEEYMIYLIVAGCAFVALCFACCVGGYCYCKKNKGDGGGGSGGSKKKKEAAKESALGGGDDSKNIPFSPTAASSSGGSGTSPSSNGVGGLNPTSSRHFSPSVMEDDPSLMDPRPNLGEFSSNYSVAGLTYGDQSIASMDYDYSKVAFVNDDGRTVSTAGGTLGTSTNRSLGGGTFNGGGGGTIDNNTVFTDEQGSFRNDGKRSSPGGKVSSPSPSGATGGGQQRGREEILEIVAPPGKLGVVIDTPETDDGVPVIHAIKESSCVAGKLHVGDRLVAVDDEDVRAYSAIKVSKLISRKSGNPTRRLTIIRNVAD